ncbi:heavy metal sensor histidine kinase [Pseudomonas sp. FSL R10-0056]|uniref:heavy metal sensor histidine kinase n=1 Tax=Pseudomonas TaxID=286 RepID=UPI00129509BD|nr:MULTISPECIES: heavy metal sensor histidine kinase [unclassified Pseudomonas]MQT65043.1 heavy metal sensor histidine kinase [Pseudomonas sp. FSL R10-0056]MQT70683.1 heavy metal sensor histidine kinase [Pseudomonas sp. FSL R10-0071]MQU49747.1 heavy metal sensor histidine kinase [Pseudomonas sp. FSL A6-1183]
MKRVSLTFRLSMMFVCAVVAVLVVAGFTFDAFSRHHFKALDRQAMTEKLESIRQIMDGEAGSAAPSEVVLQLQALLGAHQELSASITTMGGKTFFATSNAVGHPSTSSGDLGNDMWEWTAGGHVYRGMKAQVHLANEAEPMTAWLNLDITRHMHFVETLRWWLVIGLAISALISAGLGWLVARSGLKPVAQVTQVAASMSAGSLKERIPMDSVPRELELLVTSFNAMLARLEESFARLSNFSADIAHELRTPISSLRTHTEVILTRKRAPEDYEENLYSNLEDLNRLSSIIDGMLFLAKSDNGLVLPAKGKVELRSVVEKLFEYYQLLADDTGLKLQAYGDGAVYGDVTMLDRVISNLLSNALRYAPPDSTISVKIEPYGRMINLSVVNPGEEIASEHLPRLFDRFYRVDPARREGATNNAGLGLAIVKSLVDVHEGKVGCVSIDGHTTFIISLPAWPVDYE